MVCSITSGIVSVVLYLRGILQTLKVKHRIILSSVVTFVQKIYRQRRYVSKYVCMYIQSGPKKCIHSLLINIFGINLNEISISG